MDDQRLPFLAAVLLDSNQRPHAPQLSARFSIELRILLRPALEPTEHSGRWQYEASSDDDLGNS
jgi:hypothetical protein